ncbi:MAG: rhomboid family intramembrane serine protease [Caulobacter sp. 12-67-6]|nr:MAG: rhomboid family intramembrane serine protease [Caulobacter sp. 12-67-6]OYX70647.1 MAG: rhomboid family intramembrane serine protease [Caulobacter sp. 32-67-35]OYX97644.1 MAG: rhomboid family intramembrane serine protease [Caulobacter sp. 35-67-4]
MTPDPSFDLGQDRPEPMFNAPWPAVLAAASIVISNFVLGWVSDETIYRLAMEPVRVWSGDVAGLVTSLFVHGGWIHALMNAAFALAFGAPVARLLGLGVRGGGLFGLLYIACGVLAGLGYAAIHPQSTSLVVGASGAVAGLMGGAARLLDRPGQLSSLFAPRALSLALGWLVINLVMAAFGGFPGLTGAVAWEAHLFGFAAGALLISPAAWLAPRSETH